eukprot:CAMPEP_0197825438 /NCGR_PEP_ID=MMETSP1437-20131217/2521_1 /TAXON_ID=49252 ORGANISM="Eucampia antarctica, Strain CCMP1452" /NCGR_SAMPLE_ID=MMETSP1437 /ASSEMBLY_ACC=CAM_ASM_001096 /LENGTH=181 /DNA_ID=CAMNT_0043425435 /DNA_START=83 /DNA_END=628 /DNA_ORIENTATION=+
MKSFQLSFALFFIIALAGLPLCFPESGASRPTSARAERDDRLIEDLKRRRDMYHDRLLKGKQRIKDHESGNRLMDGREKSEMDKDIDKLTQLINDLDFLDNPDDPANKRNLERELVRLREREGRHGDETAHRREREGNVRPRDDPRDQRRNEEHRERRRKEFERADRSREKHKSERRRSEF